MADLDSQSHSITTCRLPSPQTPTSSLSRSQAAALLLHRRTIRKDLKAWCTEALSRVDLRPAQHHVLLLDSWRQSSAATSIG